MGHLMLLPFSFLLVNGYYISDRKELHSFGATIVAFSAGLHWITTELAVMIYMDEFSILVKVF